jgi:ABC-2 type transport system permease protein
MGMKVGKKLVLDPQNASLPVPVPRNLGGITVREIVRMPYPHFPDIRQEGIASKHPITSSLLQATVPWASPIELASDSSEGDIKHTPLLSSSLGSWTSEDLTAMPDYQTYPEYGFTRGMERQSHVLAASAAGVFTSHFAGERSPLLPEPDQNDGEKADNAAGDDAATDPENAPQEDSTVGTVLQKSSDSARLVLIASNSFAEDTALNILSQSISSEYNAPQQFIANAVDWALSDTGLLKLRGREQLARTLEPMDEAAKRRFEWSQYGFALAGLGLVLLTRRAALRIRRRRHQEIVSRIEVSSR